MIGLIQRVTRASVHVDGACVGSIDRGLLVLVGVRPHDTPANAARLAQRLLAYRVFPDDAGRMNRSVVDICGGMLLVPQFTLAADTRRGNRASFTTAAPPSLAEPLFERLVSEVSKRLTHTARGRFGADMQVSLVNDGPVTFWLEG